MPLDEVRKKIDKLDHELIRLFSERALVAKEVGEIKKREGLAIFVPDREEALLKKLSEQNTESGSILPNDSLRAIYREILSVSRALQQDQRIAVLGPEGTWTHQAAIKQFGHAPEYLTLASFADVFDLVTRRKADFGVLPIENSFNGAVSDTLDLLVDSPLKICGQIMLRIDHCILANCAKEDIKVIYSHPQALAQCKQWLKEELPHAELLPVASTARAAEEAVLGKDSGVAALGNPLCAELCGLKVLEYSIQDSATNTTRFLILGEEECEPTGNDRTSILFAIDDKPGALVSALGAFESFSVNLSKIESRPSKQKDWEYIFYVDVAGHSKDAKLVQAIDTLQQHCSMIKILGSYPDSTL